MAKKEPTIEEKLRRLYELQLIDTEIDEIEILKGELPMEVEDLEDEIAGLTKRVEKIQGSIDELNDKIAGHNAKIKEAEALIERYDEQLKSVKNNREYDALTKELELQRLEIQLAEKRIKEARKSLEAKEETLKETQERLDAKEEELNTKKKELKKIISKTEKEEKKLRKESEKSRNNIEDRLLRSYDKIRDNYRNGLAVVTVERDACGGCYAKIPPQLQLEISQRKKIIVCEHCGRILVDSNILEEKKEEAAAE